MKQFKLKGVMLFVETNSKLNPEQEIYLDTDLSICGAIVVSKEDFPVPIGDAGKLGNTVLMYHPDMVTKYVSSKMKQDDLFDFSTMEDIDKSEKITIIASKNLRRRMATKEETKLINDFLYKEDKVFKVTKEETFMEGQLFAFDINNNYQLIFGAGGMVHTNSDGKKDVMFCWERYCIKYGIVYEFDEGADYDDFDEDISEITDILK